MAGLKFRALLDTKENVEVFRDIVIPDSATFEDLFNISLQAFEFKGGQMASFYVSNDEWDKGQEVTLEDLSFGEGDAAPVMATTSVRSYIEAPDQKFILVYDFIRMWIILFELVGYERETPEKPFIALSVGAAPKEDSRGEDETASLFAQNGGEFGEFDDEDDDELGFNDFDDDYSEEDYGSFDDYDY